MSDKDYTEQDAEAVLAMPLNRWCDFERFGQGVVTQTYSNGTEQGFAGERADLVLQMGPALRRVLYAGIRALTDDAPFQSYLAALYMGDNAAILAYEASVRPPPREPEPVTVTTTTNGRTRKSRQFANEAEAMTWIGDEMVADLERWYPA